MIVEVVYECRGNVLTDGLELVIGISIFKKMRRKFQMTWSAECSSFKYDERNCRD